MNRYPCFRLALLVLHGLAASAAAAPAINFTGVTGGYSDSFQRVIGWEFTTGSRAISVDRLGAYDHLQNGLAGAHFVGIYTNASQSLVAAAMVPAGSSAPLTGFFRYAPIVPATLSANTEYVIAATWPAGTDPLVWSPTVASPPAAAVNLTVDSAITLGHTLTGLAATARYEDTTSALEFPDKRVSGEFPGDPRSLFIGPNFSFTMLPRRRDLGDYNDDGTISAADYVVWRDAQTTFSAVADGDSDGDVDQADYNVWRSHFGQTIPGSGAYAPVPEPPTMLLIGLSVAAIVVGARSVRR